MPAVAPVEHAHVFVYGTLKRRGSNHAFLVDQTYLGEARTIAGYRLFNLGDYPGMVPFPSDTAGVTGEVWSVTPAALARLDALEGLAEGLYRREPIVLLSPFSDCRVETYLYARSVAGRPDLGSTWTDR
jgi:gamma-glutamylcyclotransferase (GGCT)/AIG2-like uncharacterized protein YtfP